MSEIQKWLKSRAIYTTFIHQTICQPWHPQYSRVKFPQCSIKASASMWISRRRKSNRNLQMISSSLLLFLINSSALLSYFVSRMNARRSRVISTRLFCWFTSQFYMSFNIEFHYQLSMWMDDKLIDSYVKICFFFFFIFVIIELRMWIS